MYELSGVVQNYAWGHPSHIATLLGQHHGEPQAEYWLGAHPRGAAKLGGNQTLDQLVAENPAETLGVDVADEYGQLPYLVKILAAAKPLSIQCHPSKAQAEAGFARENAAGIALGAATRTYRDDNHKPELICALTSFQAKVGFRPLAPTRELFELLAAGNAEFDELLSLLRRREDETTVLASALRYLLSLDVQTAARLVTLAVDQSRLLAEGGRGMLDDERRSALAWTPTIDQHFPGDIGVVVALLLHHVSLEPGQAIALQAGNLHAYIEGVGVEVMANSDNVVRGGLTPKHIDVDELLSVVDTTPATPRVDVGSGASYRYISPFPEFALTSITSASGGEFSDEGPEIWLVTDGEFTLTSSQGAFDLTAGDACFVSAEEGSCRLTGAGQCWRVTTG